MALIAPEMVWAQDADIIVTAQRREERLQDVPISAMAFSADSLAKTNISSAMELTRLVPGLTMTSSGGTLLPFIRGVGNPSTSFGNEASVPAYVDGVYYMRLSPDFMRMRSIERVEVLKGPQGTLFGRNSSGGLIQLVTRTPGREPHFEMMGGFGNYDTVSAALYASTPITDVLAADITLDYSRQHEGWGENVISGAEFNRRRHFLARSKIIFTPSEKIEFTVSGDYTDSRNTIGIPGAQFEDHKRAYPGTGQAVELPQVGFYDVRSNIEPYTSDEGWGGSFKADWDLNFAQLTATTAARGQKAYNLVELDFSEVPFLQLDLPGRLRQFSQEVQLLSKAESPFDWAMGFFHYNSKAVREPTNLLSGLQFGGNKIAYTGYHKTLSDAVYGQATVPIGEATKVTGGVRYTWDKVSAGGGQDVYSAATGALLVQGVKGDAKTTYGKFSFRLAVDHKIGDTLIYASQSRGYKSATYNTFPFRITSPVSRPETVDASEIGVKTSLLDRKLYLNAAVFYSKVKDPQVSRLDGGTFQLINAGGTRAYGLDIDGQATLAHRLKARFGLSWVNSEYTDFTGAPSINPALPPLFGNGAQFASDATGNKTPRTPKVALNIGLDYSIDSSIGTWDLGTSYAYNAGFYFDPDNRVKQPSVGLVDAYVRLSPTDRLAIKLWVSNLTSEKSYVQFYENPGAGGDTAAAAAPRLFGIELTYKY
jgi:iron complex outermembrane receptor protein